MPATVQRTQVLTVEEAPLEQALPVRDVSLSPGSEPGPIASLPPDSRRLELVLGQVLSLDRMCAERLGIEALRPEARLLFILARSGSLRVKEAMSLSGLSYRGFYMLLQRLVSLQLVVVEGDHVDRRVRNIRLANPSLFDLGPPA